MSSARPRDARPGFAWYFAGVAVGLVLAAPAFAPAAERLPGPPPTMPEQVVGAPDPEVGRQLMAALGCGACHRIPGVVGAHGRVGPSLEGLSGRAYIAGGLPNTADNLIRWLLDPPALAPATAMPDMGLRPEQARAIAHSLLDDGD